MLQLLQQLQDAKKELQDAKDTIAQRSAAPPKKRRKSVKAEAEDEHVQEPPQDETDAMLTMVSSL